MKYTFILFAFVNFPSGIVAPCTPNEPVPGIILTVLSTTNTICQKANGKIIVQASGGVAPYDYTLTGPINAQNTNGAFINLKTGSYAVTVTDALGQVATQNVILTNTFNSPTPSWTYKQKPSGCNTYDGILTLAGSGGVSPYTYSLDNINYQTNNTFSNLTAGVYYYAVKDANGCSSYPSPLIYAATLDNNCSEINCNSSSGNISCNPLTISLTLTSVSTNHPPCTYSKDGINYQISSTFQNLTDGFNTFWIKDAVDNIFLYSISLMDPCNPAFLVSTIIQAAHCGTGGAITVTATEGTAPYQYSLDGINYQASNHFTGLTPGNYTVTVKDFYNFTSSKFVVVTDNCLAVAANSTSSTCGNSNGKITAQAYNGTMPYQFSLDGVNFTTNNIFINLAANPYAVYAKDATGTVATNTVTVNNIPGPQFGVIDITPTNCDNKSGAINVTTLGGIAPLKYSIDGIAFQSSSIFTGLRQGLYTITIKDANNCTVTQAATVTMVSTIPVVNFGIDKTLCEGNTLLLDATNTNSTYLWQDNSTAATYLVSKAGEYSVSVNKQGCIAKDTIKIAYDLKPKFSLGQDRGLCQGSSLVLDPKLTNVSYLWQDGSTLSTYMVTQPGQYSLAATNTCGTTTDEIIIAPGVCQLYVPNSFTPNGDTKNDIFRASYGDNVTEFHLQVYHRYGQILFETKDKQQGWDGSFKGAKQPQGTYTWVIRYKTALNKEWQVMRGTVLLLQ
jgi:gliding motility-associated-like protein